jgi:hypothetical protein
LRFRRVVVAFGVSGVALIYLPLPFFADVEELFFAPFGAAFLAPFGAAFLAAGFPGAFRFGAAFLPAFGAALFAASETLSPELPAAAVAW